MGAPMFKSLKDRLKGVSKQLEDSLDFEATDDLDIELGKQLDAELEAALAAETTAPESVVEAQPEPTPAPAVEPASEPEVVPEPEVQGPEVTPTPEAQPEPMPEPQREPEPTVEAPAEPVVRGPVPEPVQAPVVQPEPVKAPVQEKEPEIITGRKQVSEEEIARRLAQELEAAVDVQKEVERTVGETKASTRYTINEQVLEDLLWELEIGLLESDVALPVIEAIKNDVKEQLLSMSVGGKSAEEIVERVLRNAIRRVLSVQTLDFDAFIERKMAEGVNPIVIMFVGVNGTGKTTSIGRIAHRLQQKGIHPVLAAGDTFRAGAIEQLQQHGDNLGLKVIRHTAGADPAAVAYDAIEHAKARHKPVVLLDTAGRMQTNTNLMAEMDKIRRVAKPHLTVFVGDSLAGNDAVEQARRFDDVVDIDGAILTKTDVDAKGGAALSVAYTINKPLLFIGTGQNYPDLIPFNADWMVERLFQDE